MWRHWANHPPLQMMVAAYLGIKPKDAPAADQDAAFGEVLAMFGIAPGSTGGVIR